MLGEMYQKCNRNGAECESRELCQMNELEGEILKLVKNAFDGDYLWRKFCKFKVYRLL